jgi:hypothetical protein
MKKVNFLATDVISFQFTYVKTILLFTKFLKLSLIYKYHYDIYIGIIVTF